MTGLLTFAALIWCIVLAVDNSTVKTVWYAAEYQISTGKIHVDAKPQDCNFMHAPLGNKDCHYESVVTAYNAAGELVGGDDAPKYSHDIKTGKPIVSWDGGKSWVWFPGAEIPDQKVNAVCVSWTKKTD